MVCSNIIEYLTISDYEHLRATNSEIVALFDKRFALIREAMTRNYFRNIFIDSVLKQSVMCPINIRIIDLICDHFVPFRLKFTALNYVDFIPHPMLTSELLFTVGTSIIQI